MRLRYSLIPSISCMYVNPCSSRSVALPSWFSVCDALSIVFSDSPAAFMRRSVFITESVFLVGCWGRRLASASGWESLCILVPLHLDWFRIPAWGVGDPGFKSQRPHHKFTIGV